MTPQTASFIVTGAPASGKTAFISSISGIPNADAAEIVISDSLHIALTALPFDAEPTHLEASFEAALGVVLLVDSTEAQLFLDVPHLIEQIHTIKPVPIIIAVNKQDLPAAQPPAAVRRYLDEDAEIKVFPCIATDKSSAEKVLLALIYQLLG